MSEPDEEYGTEETVDEPEGAEQLGDSGKKALDSMKSRWQTERDRRKAIETELAKLKESTSSAQQTEVEKARTAARAEALAEVLKDRALDRVETKAAKLFADPEDARALLASKVDEFIDDGKVDTDAIDKALADLLKRKPHLGADQRRFKGSADGGARDGNSTGKITAADAKRMLAEGRHAEIVKAQDEGRIDWDSARKR